MKILTIVVTDKEAKTIKNANSYIDIICTRFAPGEGVRHDSILIDKRAIQITDVEE